MKTKNTLYVDLAWEQRDLGEGIVAYLDQDAYKVSRVLICPISDDVEKSLKRYDHTTLTKNDAFAFYVHHADGEWRPFATGPDYPSLQKWAEGWLLRWTDNLLELDR